MSGFQTSDPFSVGCVLNRIGKNCDGVCAGGWGIALGGMEHHPVPEGNVVETSGICRRASPNKLKIGKLYPPTPRSLSLTHTHTHTITHSHPVS